MKKILKIFLFLLLPLAISSQTTIEIPDELIGFWEGAIIRENAYQQIDVQLYEQDGNLLSLQIMEEWQPTYGEFVIPVTINQTGEITMNTGVGKAVLRLDPDNLELVGFLEGLEPANYVHFKKVPDPPKENFELIPLTIPNGDISLFGHLHVPEINSKNTAIILVGGRGCGADATAYNLYAQFLRKYGMAVLAYQKRGTGNSTGNCTTATIDNLASDVSAVYQLLKAEPYQFDKIGVLGISAGGWTMVKAAEDINFDFMISIVGPSTSVYDQQMQSMQYGAEFYELDAEAMDHLKTYTEYMFTAKANSRGFTKMNTLLEMAEQENWKQLLEDTDVPKDENDMNNLWVRRHNYDPGPVLQKYANPFLAIYGGRDWISPSKENVELLKKYFADRLDLLTTVTAYEAEHGLEKEARAVELNDGQSYWHFYRIAPEARIEIISFLRKHHFIE